MSQPGVDHELEALRAQVEELEREKADLQVALSETTGHKVGRVLKSIAAAILVLLGVLCLVLSPLTIWSRNLLLNTDRYVETITPVASDPGVQQAVIKAVDTRIMARIDIDALLGEVLEPRAVELLSGPLESGLGTLVTRVTTQFVESDAFETLWIEANRAAHNQVVYAVTGERPEGAAIAVSNSGVVTLDISKVVDRVKAALVEQGLDVAARIPSVGATVQIADITAMTDIRRVVRLLNAVANWLPWLGLVLIVGGVLTARRRRRAVMWAAGGLAAGMLLLALALVVGRNYYLDKLPDQFDQATGQYLFDTLVRFLRDGLRLVFVVALVVMVITWLTGSSRPVLAARHAIRHGSTNVADRLATSSAGPVVDDYAWPLRVGIAALAALVLVLWPEPTAVVIIVVALLGVLALVLLELVRSARRTSSQAHEDDPFVGAGAG